MLKEWTIFANTKMPLLLAAALTSFIAVPYGTAAAGEIDFNRDIRTILSNNCLYCHGPDKEERKGGVDGLRLDTPEGATADLGGYKAIVPGDPKSSALIERILHSDPEMVMPPPSSGKKLSKEEVDLLRAWVEQGAKYAEHWAYVVPTSPLVPAVEPATWPKNAIDHFILARLMQEKISPQPEADRSALIRRASLDLTGLPPTWDEVQQFVGDSSPDAYEKMVDRLLDKHAYGEHWARMWLDLARYADSAGYADDPPRTIWAYRDYVVRAFNNNMPFDQFTVEQIAGDLLPNPTDDQLIATAFNRNTLTNNEGGTNDEEFRNVAVVDRVNTTFAVWMGTTMACAQCHTHKYDPISQEEYFQLFAIFNQSADADSRDEQPLLEVWSDQQKNRKVELQQQLEKLRTLLATPTEALAQSQANWERAVPRTASWVMLQPESAQSAANVPLKIEPDGIVATEKGADKDTLTIRLPIPQANSLTALRLETLANIALPGGGPGWGGGNFVLSQIKAKLVPPTGSTPKARFVRVELPGTGKILSLAEVEVFSAGNNVAKAGKATQISTSYDAGAERAIDGITEGDFFKANSVTHTEDNQTDPWWEVDLGSLMPVEQVVVWNRTGSGVEARLNGFRVVLLDEQRQPVWNAAREKAPAVSEAFGIDGSRELQFASVIADFEQPGFSALSAIQAKIDGKKGWGVGSKPNQDHSLLLIPEKSVDLTPGSILEVELHMQSDFAQHIIGRSRISISSDPAAIEMARVPSEIHSLLAVAAESRTPEQLEKLAAYYRTIAPELEASRNQAKTVEEELAALKPMTSVPVMRDLMAGARRQTYLQHRGNYLDKGPLVTEGVPVAFGTLPEGSARDRMALAKWLVDRRNPLTARVLVNRLWEQMFGTGIVATPEEFGSQGDLPSHPELLDWLAVELIDSGWNVKHILKLMVSSAAYRQSSKITGDSYQRDPDNRLLGRGPRFRLPAETIRDQALAVSGLISPKLYGPPVKPPQPSLGLSAAFGSSTDWQTSSGEDRYRRGVYTTWRRSNPYPSMATFDAPNREVCTLRRTRTNTPLQALVTLNDPVFIEAAQALARKVLAVSSEPQVQAEFAIRTVLSREASPEEIAKLVELLQRVRPRYEQDPVLAKKMATEPLGNLPEGVALTDAAAWTVVANAILNLDEFVMKR